MSWYSPSTTICNKQKLRNKDLNFNTEAYNLLGVAFQILGDTESARQVFLQSVELNPDSFTNPWIKWLLLIS